jgi:probable rRNA maturation factor
MILNRQRKVRVALQPLEAFLRRIRRELNLGKTEITIALVSDPQMARLNEQFRRKKGPTDVLSFPASSANKRTQRRAQKSIAVQNGHTLGDVAIAPLTAKRYAKKNDRTLESELRVLILHGILHLLGYDHETDRGRMNRVERRLRRRLGLA